MGGLSFSSSTQEMSASHFRTHKAFLLFNYLTLGCASGCIFLTLSLRLLPTLTGLALILLHFLTIFGAISGCTAANASTRSSRWYAAHMVSAVLTAIFQGAVSVLVFTRTSEFLTEGLKTYVREDDGAVILRMVGGLGVAMFCLEWVVMGLGFALRYYDYVDGEDRLGGVRKSTAKVQHDDQQLKDWPWPFQV